MRIYPKAEKHPMWNGGRRINSQGYILVYSPEHPHKDRQNSVREHRLVMEQKLGRYLEPNEVVHHLNGIKDDNRIENLSLLLKKEHDKLSIEERPLTGKHKNCLYCGKQFYVAPSLDRVRCCSNSCSKKHIWKIRGKSAFGR